MRLDWACGSQKNGQFKPITGTSENQVSVTLGDPATSPLYHTLVHLGCKNAKGEIDALPSTLPSGEEKRGAIAAIWEEFRDLRVTRISTDMPMQYWGPYSSQNLESPPDDFFTTAGLLKNGDGRCYAWANLFVDILKAQGIAVASVKEIRTKDAMFDQELWMGDGFWVNEFLEAQGPNEHPYTGPFTHAVIMLEHSSSIYDPSYGKAYSNLVAWEDLTVNMFRYVDQES